MSQVDVRRLCSAAAGGLPAAAAAAACSARKRPCITEKMVVPVCVIVDLSMNFAIEHSNIITAELILFNKLVNQWEHRETLQASTL